MTTLDRIPQLSQLIMTRRLSSDDLRGKRPAQVPLRYAWPHDADAPIPVWLLLKAIENSPTDPAPSLRRALQQVPLWNAAISEGFPWAKESRHNKLTKYSGVI